MVFLRALLGVLSFCLFAWLLGDRQRKIPWRVVIGGIGLQVVLGAFILNTHAGNAFFDQLAQFVAKLIGMTESGTTLVFGPLISKSPPDSPLGFVFAFAGTGLTVIIFLSALMAILYYLGIMQAIIWALAHVMSVTMGVSGAESMCMAANIFMGQTEAPLTIRPYMPRLTRSELNSVMTGGFATMAAGMIAIYISVLGHGNFYGKHILAAEVMSAPAAFVVCKLMRPERELPETSGKMPFKIERNAHNLLEAAANGTRDGMMLWLNVIAMLISFGAILALINWGIGAAFDGWSLERIAGILMAPIAWLVGGDNWHDCRLMGSVMGTKIASNEFFGFLQLAKLLPNVVEPATTQAASQAATMATTAASMPSTAPAVEVLSQRSAILNVYSICDFANFVSIGIQIGGMTPLAPDRKADFAKLAFRAMLGGCLASYMTAAIAGLFV